MRYLKLLALVGVFLFSASFAHAQSFSVGFGVGPVYEGPAYGPPDCVYGYYSYYPYACAPYGYYGPDWFSDGFFIGAGPWYHGYYGRGDFDGRWHGFGRGYYGRDFQGRGDYGRRGFGGEGFRGERGFGGGAGRGDFRGGFRGGESHGGGGYRGGGGFHGGGGGGNHGGGGSHGGGHR